MHRLLINLLEIGMLTMLLSAMIFVLTIRIGLYQNQTLLIVNLDAIKLTNNKKLNTVKKLLLILLFIPILSFGQSNFKITSNNELVWEKIVDEKISIESQTINLKSTTKKVIYLRDIHSAELTVQHKGNRTRLYVKNIKSKSALDDDSENIDGIVINKKGEFKKFFISRGDYKFLEKSINKSIESLIEENNW